MLDRKPYRCFIFVHIIIRCQLWTVLCRARGTLRNQPTSFSRMYIHWNVQQSCKLPWQSLIPSSRIVHNNLIVEVYFPIPALLSVKYKNPQIYINIYIFILKVLLFYNGNKIIFILSKKHRLALGGGDYIDSRCEGAGVSTLGWLFTLI